MSDEQATPSTEKHPHGPAQLQRQQELQQQLLGCLKQPWSSLVVVPAQPDTSVRFIAEALAEVAWLVRAREAKLFSTEGLDVAGASKVIVDATGHVASGGLAVVCIESVVTRQAGIPVAMAMDAALLCVPLGRTEHENARRTVELIGARKFIGAVTIRPD